MVSFIQKASTKYSIIFSVIVTSIVLLIASFFNWDSNPITGFDKLIGDILITVFCLIIIHILGIWQTAGFHKKGFGKGLIYGVPFIIIGIFAAMIGNIGVDIANLQPVSMQNMIIFTINMVFVGVNEEISMRSLVLNNLILKYGDSKRGTYKAIFISAVIFGLIHFVNIFFISSITVVVQVINAMSAGVLFAAIYICSSNIWSCIVIHALVDWLSLFVGQCFIGGQSVLSFHMTIPQGIVIVILGSLPPIVIAVMLLNKKQNYISTSARNTF